MADMRRCIGSATFGIEPHDAPTADFPTQPSQKDGLGRMCKTHWNEYTTALRKAALARKAAEAAPLTAPESEPAVVAPKGSRGRKAKGAEEAEPELIRTRAPRGRAKADPVAEAEPVVEFEREPVAG